MKKILSRYLVLITLLGCLGLISVADFRAGQNPPCPENCHFNCKVAFESCKAGCGSDENCIHQCKVTFESCMAFCDFACGPE